LTKVPCDCNDKVAAEQLFPVFLHENTRLPTVKHHCPRTVVASALRACSNQVDVDPNEFVKFEKWFRKVFIPEFISCLDQEVLTVDMEEWLNEGRYSIPYRENLRKGYRYENYDNRKYKYDAFTKVELGFTQVPYDQKETELNDIKERQICGPSDQKKVAANAFINLLEGVAHRHLKYYCGRKNWPEICQAIENSIDNLPNMLFGAADGSGFDMSQLKVHNSLLNELLRAAAKHPNVTWNEPLTIEEFLRAIEQSLTLDVSMANGDFKYSAQGRASGDGWTTFGNTMLMSAYWKYTFDKCGVHDYFLMVKGDDVLFGLNPNKKEYFDLAVSQVFTMNKHRHCHGLAQICKKILWGPIEDLDFLSNHFFWTESGRLRMTRIPARVFQSLPFTTKLYDSKYKEVMRQELVYSKGDCLLAWGRGLPIWEALGTKMKQLGRPGKASEYNQYSDKARIWQNRDDRRAYMHYLSVRYGVTNEDVLFAEEQIRGIKALSGSVYLEFLDKFY